MAHIEVDFECWKALTARRDSETHSYNDVIRSLLGLAPAPQAAPPLTAQMILEGSGRTLGGRYLPHGTRLRAKYKDSFYYAEIAGGRILGEGGKAFGSASAAARAVTKTNVNGLTFWDVKRPEDGDWQKLLELPRTPK